MNNKWNIIGIASGVDSSLVASKLTDGDIISLSIQDNKYITPRPKISLMMSSIDFKKFIDKLKKEFKGHSTPRLKNVAELYCDCFAEILRIVKVNNDTFDVMMYYNYKRPRTKTCKDCVSLRTSDLEKFIGGEQN